MHNNHFNMQEARQIDMVEYLEKLGYQPQIIRNYDYWYLSPLREEREVSFKVNRKLNLYYDHGAGRGGSIIDFGTQYHKCSIPQFLQKLSQSFSFHCDSLSVQQPGANTIGQFEALEPKIKVIAVKPLTNPTFCRYLQDRKIPVEIAEKYCKEVDFELNDKRFFAVGFENRSGGFELRNAHFKGSSSPKDVTQIETSEAKDITVFEGFFSFLSYQTLYQKDTPLTNLLVLNSLSFFEKSRQLMEKNQKINLYLDRDRTGIKNTQRALKWDSKYIDRSDLYKNHKDLNDYLISKSQQQNQVLKIKRRL